MSHPLYYGGEEDPYEAIKVIQAWGLNFSLGSVLKYVKRAGAKEGEADLKDLRKARDYINFEIAAREGKPTVKVGQGFMFEVGDKVILACDADDAESSTVGVVTSVGKSIVYVEWHPQDNTYKYAPHELMLWERP